MGPHRVLQLRVIPQYLMLACLARVGTAAGSIPQGLAIEPGVQCSEGRAAQKDVHVSLAATVLVGAPISANFAGLKMRSGGNQDGGLRTGSSGIGQPRERGHDYLSRKGFRDGDRVILYDGVCNMCNGWVNYVLDRDRDARFRFAALQGESGRALMRMMGRNPNDLSTLVLLESDSTVYTKSEAVLRVLSELGGATGTLASVTRKLIPRRLRDFVYADIVAPHRYKMFGTTPVNSKCRRITKQIKTRFLD